MNSIKILEDALEYKDNYEDKVSEAANYISQRFNLESEKQFKPEFGIVLGSGLDELSKCIEDAVIIPYRDIPNFPIPTVDGHEGKMIIGSIQGVRVIGLKGRKHYYECAGELFDNGRLQTVFPVHVLANLSVKNYFVTNAAGGLNMECDVGDMMVITSHINTLPNPLTGRKLNFKRVDNNEPTSTFEPVVNAYSPRLTKMLFDSGSLGLAEIKRTGVYMSVTGPSYESEAECLAFRKMRADAVGMSTTNEVIVARNRGMNVVGFSCITNCVDEKGRNSTSHEEVKRVLESPGLKADYQKILTIFFDKYARQNR
jgi:purine-nucleoside phosphorylase